MKHLLFKIALFLLPITVIWLGTELFYRTVQNNYTFKKEQLQKQKNTIKILVFGDSHAFFGVNPEYINEHTFNIANISQSLYFDALLFDQQVTRLPDLKQIVLTINYTTLSQVDDTSEDVWRKYFYKSQMDLEVPIVSKYDPKRYSLALTRRFSKSLELFSTYHKNGTIINCDANGWGNNYLIEKSLDLEKTAKNIVIKHEDGLLDFETNLNRIRSIIDKCTSNQIEVFIVFMPVSESYWQRVNPIKVTAIDSSLRELRRVSKNVKYLNLFKDHRFSNNDFYDANHLNNSGAAKCSKIIGVLLK